MVTVSEGAVKELQAEILRKELPPLIHRDFVNICSDEGQTVRVMQWNMLAHGLCGGSDNFILCPKEALAWETRKLRVIEEIVRYNPTILCMEEVDKFEFLTENLAKHGYVGIFHPKPDSPCLYQADSCGPDGCALFYKPSLVALAQSNCINLKENETVCNQVAILGEFQTKSENPKVFHVGVTHLKAKRGFEGVRKLQAEFIVKYLEENCSENPVIFVGDFNAEPTEPLYQVMVSSKLGLTSAYTCLSKDGQTEPKYTTWKARPGKVECHTIDYIWFTKLGIKVKAILDVASDEEIGQTFLPSLRYPSDHISLVCDFFIDQK